MPHSHANLGETTPRSVFYDEGRFGWLFPTLPPLAADTPSIRDALAELGAAGGPMDPGDDLSDPSPWSPTRPRASPTPTTGHHGRVHLPRPVPRPRHDLRPHLQPGPPPGPGGDPELPHPRPRPRQRLRRRAGRLATAVRPEVDGGQTSLLVEEIPGSGAVSIDGSTRMDVPRNRQLVALVGDPRNDENLIVSQLQLASCASTTGSWPTSRPTSAPATPARSCSPKPSGW